MSKNSVPIDHGRIRRYGMLRLHFIAQNKQALYETLLMTNKLTHHLLLESRSCENYYKELMENYIKNDERLYEKNKELNPLEWTKLMNNYKNTVAEIVLNEYIIYINNLQKRGKNYQNNLILFLYFS